MAPNVRGPLNSSAVPEGQVVSGTFNAQPPAPLDGQGCSLQLDSQGNLKVVNEAGGVASIVQIEDTAGNPITTLAGSLNVNVTSPIVASNPSVGLTGAAAPTSATEVGGVDSTGKLRAPTAAVLTNATALAVEIVDANGNQITTFGSPTVSGTLTNNNAAPAANNVGALTALANAANPTWTEGDLVLESVDLSGNLRVKVNAALPAGTNVIGHVIADTGSTTAVTGNVTVVQPTGTNLHVVVDTAPTTAENLIQVAGVTLGVTAVTNFGTAPAATAVPGVNSSVFAGTTGITATGTSLNANITNTVPVTLTSTTVTNTVAENLTQVAGVVLGSTAVTAYGTPPAAANVPGVNAFITNTPAVTLASTTITGNVTVVQPTGTNLHVVVDSGSALTASVTGTKSNNAVAPGATNLGVLPAIANAATQTWTEGDQVLESVDLSGRQRVRGTLTHNAAAPTSDLLGVMNGLANAAAPTYVEGDLVLQSVDLSGNTRVVGTKTNNTAAPTTQVGVLPALANAASPAWVEGNQVLESVDLTGRQRVRGTLTNNNAAPSTDGQMSLGALANAAAPTWTEGDLVLLSEDLSGRLRVLTTPAAGTTTAIVGTLTNNNAAPAATEIGVLPALANAASPTWVEGDQVLESVDLTGRQRVRGTLTHNNAAPTADLIEVMPAIATTASPTYTTGDSVMLSTDLTGQLRVTPTTVGTLTNNNAAPGTANLGVLPALANAANPTWTEGDQVLLSEDLTGRLRTTGGGVAQASTTAGELGPLVQGAVTTGAPAYTTAQTSPLSLDLLGNLRVILASTAGTIGTAGVRSTAIASALADNQANEVFFTSSAGVVDPLGVGDWVYGGAFSGTADAARQGWSKMRASTVFRTVQATASGSTAVWTAATGNKWRLLKVFVEVTDNASLAAGAVLTISLLDVAASINIAFDVFVPTTAVTTVVGTAAEIQLDLGQFGIQAAATATALNVNLSAALVTGNVRVIVQGTEE